ncbi:hypothetical protein C8R46DRAFT_516911 [Mycena filopes]|nr:hypothetical protein C8R46DRAFT_516911 [Mycena filopes]
MVRAPARPRAEIFTLFRDRRSPSASYIGFSPISLTQFISAPAFRRHIPNAGASGSGGSGSSSRAARRLLSPPPPPFDGSVPPVPGIPRRWRHEGSFIPASAQGSTRSFHHPDALVRRPRAARVPVPSSPNFDANRIPTASAASGSGAGSSATGSVPAPIRAAAQFGLVPAAATHAQHPSDSDSDNDHVALSAAPRARHNPPMGLGGALISTNNARLEVERLERVRRLERRFAGGRVAPLAAASGSGSGSRAGGSNSNASRASGSGILRRLQTLNPFRWGDDEEPANEINLLALRVGDRDARTRADAQYALDLHLWEEGEHLRRRGRSTRLGFDGVEIDRQARGYAQSEAALLRRWAGNGGGFWAGGWGNAGAGRARGEAEEDYKPEWTHPGKPESGFVFDFSPPNDIVIPPTPPPSGKGKGKAKEVVIDVDAEDAAKKEREAVSTLLVCARCLDPLLVRADGVVEGGEAEVKRRKVWGLRCGHLIDGKCFEELSKPPPCVEAAITNDGDATSDDALLKERGKAKGKGKARAVEEEEPEQDEEDVLAEEDYDELFDEDLIPAAISQSSSIRSRLRPRPGGVTNPASTSSMPGAFEIAVPSGSSSSTPSAPTIILPRATRRRAATGGKKRKGKAKARPKKRVVEARYEWVCPVAGCGRVHVSEKVEGVWQNDVEKGAVGVFV